MGPLVPGLWKPLGEEEGSQGSLKALARKGGGKSPESPFRGPDGQCSDATLPIRDSLCQLFSWRLVAFARQEELGMLEVLRPGDTS